jgi:hypothetical protein
MRKITWCSISILIVLFAISCNKEKVNEHAGKYAGAFSTIVMDSAIYIDGELSFSSGTTKEQNLYIYGILLEKESNNKYNLNNSVALNTILVLLAAGGDEVPTEKPEPIPDLNATFVFSDGAVDMNLRQKTETFLTFNGKRQ